MLFDIEIDGFIHIAALEKQKFSLLIGKWVQVAVKLSSKILC